MRLELGNRRLDDHIGKITPGGAMYAELGHMILNIKAASLGTNLRTGTLAVAAGLWKAIAFRPETPAGKHRSGVRRMGFPTTRLSGRSRAISKRPSETVVRAVVILDHCGLLADEEWFPALRPAATMYKAPRGKISATAGGFHQS